MDYFRPMPMTEPPQTAGRAAAGRRLVLVRPGRGLSRAGGPAARDGAGGRVRRACCARLTAARADFAGLAMDRPGSWAS
jgi:hypothetical protein